MKQLKELVQLLKNKSLREKMGKKGIETVRKKFLLSTYLEKYLDLINSFETNFLLKNNSNFFTGECNGKEKRQEQKSK